MLMDTKNTLAALYKTIEARKTASTEKSYVASLYKAGTAAICAKIMEESLETVTEALRNDTEKLKSESADLIFHIMVLWAQHGITPDDVLGVLESRMGTSGLAEKQSRQ
jgi:phosphoribosyl-ATP pyrophosphohydrolase